MIFKTISQPDVKVGELVGIEFFDGKSMKITFGIVDKIDKKHVWLKSDLYPEPIRFNLKLDQIVKPN